MGNSVKQFLKQIRDEKSKSLQDERIKILSKYGLTEREYSIGATWSEEYPLSEWNDAEGKSKFYKNIPLEVSDEEYEEIKKYYYDGSQIKQTQSNSIATALKAIAWIIFIVGFIVGIIFGNVEVTKGVYYTYTDTEFSFAIAFTYWCVSFISGMMMLGFSEIISLLNDIKNK